MTPYLLTWPILRSPPPMAPPLSPLMVPSTHGLFPTVIALGCPWGLVWNSVGKLEHSAADWRHQWFHEIPEEISQGGQGPAHLPHPWGANERVQGLHTSLCWSEERCPQRKVILFATGLTAKLFLYVGTGRNWWNLLERISTWIQIHLPWRICLQWTCTIILRRYRTL